MDVFIVVPIGGFGLCALALDGCFLLLNLLQLGRARPLLSELLVFLANPLLTQLGVSSTPGTIDPLISIIQQQAQEERTEEESYLNSQLILRFVFPSPISEWWYSFRHVFMRS